MALAPLVYGMARGPYGVVWADQERGCSSASYLADCPLRYPDTPRRAWEAMAVRGPRYCLLSVSLIRRDPENWATSPRYLQACLDALTSAFLCVPSRNVGSRSDFRARSDHSGVAAGAWAYP